MWTDIPPVSLYNFCTTEEELPSAPAEDRRNRNETTLFRGRTDAKGNRVYPITYEGSTYLPVRAVAGLAGYEVNWDQATRTVDLGETKVPVMLYSPRT